MTKDANNRFILFCTTGLGDSLFCTPAIRWLRRQVPDAEITVVAKSKILSLFATNSHINTLLGYHSNPLSYWLTRRKIASGGPYRAAYFFHVNGEVVRLTSSLPCAEAHAIKLLPGLPPATQLFPIDPVNRRQWEDFTSMVQRTFGGKNDGQTDDYEFELPPAKENQAAAEIFFAPFAAAPGPKVGMQLGGSHLGKCWPPERFAAVAAAVLQRYGGNVFVNVTNGERPLLEKFFAALPPALRARCHRLPPTTINGLAAQLARLDLFVSNDTGPLHVALAQDRPVVALKAHDDQTFPYTLPRETPLRRSIFVRTDTTTSGKKYRESHRAMECITVDVVQAEVEAVLTRLGFKPNCETSD